MTSTRYYVDDKLAQSNVFEYHSGKKQEWAIGVRNFFIGRCPDAKIFLHHAGTTSAPCVAFLMSITTGKTMNIFTASSFIYFGMSFEVVCSDAHARNCDCHVMPIILCAATHSKAYGVGAGIFFRIMRPGP